MPASPISERGYANPGLLAETGWLEEHLNDTGVRIIALHDIVDAGAPDVRRVWREIRQQHAETYEFVEFTEQYPEVTQWTGSHALRHRCRGRKALMCEYLA